MVRLAEGDFARETVYAADPVDVARGFAAAGARWIHIVDLDGARDGARRQTEVVARIVEAVGERVACEVAGGLRDEAPWRPRCMPERPGRSSEPRRCAIPRSPSGCVARFGAGRIAIALDVRDGMAVGQGWVPGAAGVPVEEALAALADRGARTFIVTAIERDGLLTGPNLDLLGRMVELGRGEIIASAGISSLADIAAVRALGCAGAIVGRALYEGRLDLAEAVRLTA